jgi:hypothetical protein
MEAMRIASAVLAVLAAASSAKGALQPLRRVTTLPMGRCDVEVTFRLSVSDGGLEDYYCPRVVWEWEDGSRSIEESDCPPFEQAAPTDHRRAWTRSRAFQRSGSYLVKAHLCKAERRIRTFETTAVVTGWEGYPAAKRESFGCLPAHLDTGGMPDPDQTQTRPPSATEPCR